MLAGERPNNRFDGTLWVKYNEEEIRRYAKPGENVSGLGIFYPFQLARQIAKIAHSLAVADYGLDSFVPFLPDIILGKSDTPFYYIGAQVSPEPDRRGTHSVQLGWLPPDDRFLISYIRLFCSYGTPNYTVVVGQRQA